MSRMKMLAVLMMLGLGLWLSGLPATAADKEDKEDKKSGDSAFVHEASAAGLAEVNFSELAVRLSRDAAVRQFAQRMVADHMRANEQLIQLANAQSIPVAKTMDKKHQEMFDKLKGKSGKEFDHMYMEGMVKDHEKAVKLFEKASKECKNEQLKQFATTLTPSLKQHLEMARKVCKQTEGDGKKEKDTGDR